MHSSLAKEFFPFFWRQIFPLSNSRVYVITDVHLKYRLQILAYYFLIQYFQMQLSKSEHHHIQKMSHTLVKYITYMCCGQTNTASH